MELEMDSQQQQYDYVERLRYSVSFWRVTSDIREKMRLLFPEAHYGVDPSSLEINASVSFDIENIPINLIEFISNYRNDFRAVFISIWAESKVSWGEFFIPESIMSLVRTFDIGIRVWYSMPSKIR